jgi:ATP-dependent exoDNAse (exonuclease V) beta subunit
MERHVVREPESASVVRVMTIHKSKGLGFDVVILPELQGNRIDERRSGLAVQKAADRSVEWVLELPPKVFFEADTVLRRHVREAEATACYEALSLLYVAFTRAKRAMYAIIEPVGSSTSRNYPKLLSETLGQQRMDIRVGKLSFAGTWTAGDPHWHASEGRDREPTPCRSTALEPLALGRAEGLIRREARQPSNEGTGRTPLAQLFSWERTSSSAFGREVHALFAEVEWYSPTSRPLRENQWRERKIAGEVVTEVMACLEAKGLSEVWSRVPGSEVWRERAFEIVLDDVWVTGVFDRVVVARDENGNVSAATVYDYKTDRVDDDDGIREALKRHARQLELYRRVAAIFTRLPVDTISCEIVFTQLRRRVRVPR